MINTALIYIITTDQHHHDHHQYNHNHHDDDDDDQEHPARAGQREDGEQEVQQPEPDHVEPFCPGRFFRCDFHHQRRQNHLRLRDLRMHY